MALVALTGGQKCAPLSQKDVYLKQGILPLTLKGNIGPKKLNFMTILETTRQITDTHIDNFYKRLVSKRPQMFMGEIDSYKLRNNQTGKGYPGDSNPSEYVLYSEIEFGALLQVAGIASNL